MSTSPANADAPACGPTTLNDGAGQTEPPSSGRGSRGKDDITVVQVSAFPPVPGFLSTDAARSPADGAQPSATPTLETEVRKLQAALNTAASNRSVKRPGHRNKLPPGVVRGSAAPGRLSTMLSRQGFRLIAGTALATMTIAAVGAYVSVILPQTDDWEVAELPPAASREPAAPPPAALPSGSEAGMAASEAARRSQPFQTPPADSEPAGFPPAPQPAAPLRPAPPPDSRPAELPAEVAALLMNDDSPAAPGPSAVPEPPAMTAREPAPPEGRPAEPPMEVAALLMNDDSPAASAPSSIPERSALTPQEPATPATPRPPALAAPATPAQPDTSMAAAREPVPPATHEPQAEWPAADRAPPGAGMAAAPRGFESADSGARHPAGAEQKMSVDRLRMAHAEIFVRKGFREDALRVSSGATETGARVDVTDPHRQYLTAAQLRRLSPDQLDLVRYEIFARRGRYFKDPALRAYFEQFAWYRPYAWDVPLTRVEQANVDLIQSYQQTMLAPGPAARPWRAPPM
jgi:hypothetical protein